MSESRSEILANVVRTIPSFIRHRFKKLRRIELNLAHKRLAKLKKEKDALIDEMDVALRTMQRRRLRRAPNARLTGQYNVDEMKPIVGGVVYDIEKLTIALDDNRRQTVQEETRITRLTQELTQS